MRHIDIRDINETTEATNSNHTTEEQSSMRYIDIRDIHEVQPTATTTADRMTRIQADREAAEAAGFELQQTHTPEGYAGNVATEAGAAKSRREFEALPLLEDGLATLENTIARELRRETSINTVNLRISENFELGVGTSGTHVPMIDRAFSQLAAAAGVQLRVAKWLRDHTLKKEASRLFQEELNNAAKDVKVRGRAASNGIGREVFAVVGPNYPVFDVAPAITGVVRQALSHMPGARVDIAYDRERAGAFIDVVFHSDVKAGDYGGGELFKAGVRVKTDDGGTGSAKVSAFVIRASCTNMYLLNESVIEIDRVVHAGSLDSRIARLTSAVQKASQKIDVFAERWSRANRAVVSAPHEAVTALSSKPVGHKTWAEATVDERVAGLTQGYVNQRLLPPLPVEQIRAIVRNYWRDDVTGTQEITLAGLANAWTATARDMDRWSGDALERAGGALVCGTSAVPVYQYVYNLA